MIPRRLATGLVMAASLVAACTADDPEASPASGSSQSTISDSVSSTTTPPATTTTSVPASTTTTTTTPPPATTLVPPPGPLVGIAVREGRIGSIEAIEQEAGATFHLVRVFTRWEVDLADTDIAEIQSGGRAVHLSVRPVRADGSAIPWRDIADAQEGSALHDEMVAWADRIVALGPDLRFTFNHEPETRESAPNGDAIDYRGAWRRMVELVRARGGDHTTMVWTVGREVLADPVGARWYPGDDVVDVIGADLYNWYTCQGTDRPWTSFEALLEPAIDFAGERGKPLAVPEFASAADPSDESRRGRWIDAAVDTMLELSEVSDVDLDYVAWFDVNAPGGTNPDCRWAHDGDVPTTRAFNRMVSGLVAT